MFRNYLRHTSPNRAYLALLHSAQIRPGGWTSDTLGTLYAIGLTERGEDVEKRKL